MVRMNKEWAAGTGFQLVFHCLSQAVYARLQGIILWPCHWTSNDIPAARSCTFTLCGETPLDQNREAAFGRVQVIGPVFLRVQLLRILCLLIRSVTCGCVFSFPKSKPRGREAAGQMQLWSALLLKGPWALGLGTWGFLVHIQHRPHHGVLVRLCGDFPVFLLDLKQGTKAWTTWSNGSYPSSVKK